MIKARVPGTKTASVLNLAIDFNKIIIVQWKICPSILFSFSSKKKRGTVDYMANWASQVALVVRNMTASAEDLRDTDSILRLGDSLEEGMATQCCVLAWRIPWTEEPGGLLFIELQRVRHN